MDKQKQLTAKGKSFVEKMKRLLGSLDKKQKKQIISAMCVAVLVFMLAVMPLVAAESGEEDSVKASVLSGRVETGSVTTTIHGGGTLAEEAAEAIRLPDGVKITEFLVENYTAVKEGDPLASVDRVTVMQAISSVQETLDYLKEEMEDAGNNTVTKSITAEAGGRVKAVYAKAGDDVTAVMTEYGALAVLSLDGMMAVDIETNAALSAGDSVWVGFSDGRDVVGRVESALNGEVVITVEDDDYAIGEEVMITDSDDDKLGKGTLYVHNAWNAVAYSGTVSSVNLKENTAVSAGKTIFSLKNAENSSEYQSLARKHRAYEELMTELFVMYQSGALQAPCDGVVSGVDKDSVHLLSDSGKYTISLLANAPGADADASYDNYVGQIAEADGTTWSVMLNPQNWGGDIDYTAPTAVSVDPACMTDGPMQMTQVTVFEFDEYGWQVVTGEVKQGDILLFASDGDTCVWAVRLVEAMVETPDEQPETDSSDPSAGEGNPPDENQTPNDDQTENRQDQQMSSGGSGMSSFGGSGGMGITGNVQNDTPELFDLNGTDILFVTPQNTVTLTITVDESEIGKLSLGQQATVMVDVLKGEEYTATVTELGTTGTNSGGNSKFTVELTMEREENMLAGQSATAIFTIETVENVLIVPVAALVADGSETVIYTGKSGETLTKPVTVTTGVSDGEFVELLSGLTEGKTYYYEYYDTLELSTAVEQGGMFGR